MKISDLLKLDAFYSHNWFTTFFVALVSKENLLKSSVLTMSSLYITLLEKCLKSLNIRKLNVIVGELYARIDDFLIG